MRYSTCDAPTLASPIPTIVKDRCSTSAESTELQTFRRVLQVVTQAQLAIPTSNQPDYYLSTKTRTTTDLRSSSTLVPVTTRGRAILCSPIHRPWHHKHHSPSNYKTQANGNRARKKLIKSSAHPDRRLLDLREEESVSD